MYTDPNPKLDYRDSRKGEFNTEVNKQITIKQLKKNFKIITAHNTDGAPIY